MAISVVSPVGRIVQGSAFRPVTTDDQGNPLVFKTGANKGQPRSEYLLALAIEKMIVDPTTRTMIPNPEWGAFWAQLGAEAQRAFPQGEYNAPTFSWKVVDGDGIDQNGKANASKEGFAGSYVVRFKSSFPVACWKGGLPHDPKTVRTGDYVRVLGTVEGNKGGAGAGVSKNGLYVNHNAIEFIGFGTEIQSGPDAKEAFGKAPVGYVPAGVSSAPIGGVPAVAAGPGTPAPAPVGAGWAGVAPAVVTPGVSVGVPPAYSVPGTVPVPGTPGAAFATPTAPVAVAPAPPPVPVAPAPLPAVIGGVPLQNWLAQGWTEATLRAHGHIV